jgi:regulator of PEP synthase PpsR (kinase-PPPase family)
VGNKVTIVYLVSDHTGLTIESVGRTILSQFNLSNCEQIVRPYIDNPNKAYDLLDEIVEAQAKATHVIVFSSFIDKNMRGIFDRPGIRHIDLFKTFLPRFEEALGQKANYEAGLSHGVGDYHKYMSRIEALNFALSHDDGTNNKYYDEADLILIGVSRSGKTPSSLYLAIQFGIYAANYPITDDDLNAVVLPKPLMRVKKKLFGLLIDPDRLQQIRAQRLPDSKYASLEQCEEELRIIEQLYQRFNIPYLNTTQLSIEEISTKILVKAGIEKR